MGALSKENLVLHRDVTGRKRNKGKARGEAIHVKWAVFLDINQQVKQKGRERSSL